jgi:prepilin-type N-terminal cleavage/methylation domain-containing protein
MRPPHRPTGFTLIEVMLAVVVTSIALLAVMKLMSGTQRSLTTSMASLQAQASAEALIQSIRRMRWDENSPATGQMSLIGNPLPSATCGSCPSVADRTAIEHWAKHKDWDKTRPLYGDFRRTVRIRFLDFDVATRRFVPTITPTHRKEVTVWAVGRNSSATITSVFYNLP